MYYSFNAQLRLENVNKAIFTDLELTMCKYLFSVYK